jgi:Late exocytosis, associated with Golgi transport
MIREEMTADPATTWTERRRSAPATATALHLGDSRSIGGDTGSDLPAFYDSRRMANAAANTSSSLNETSSSSSSSSFNTSSSNSTGAYDNSTSYYDYNGTSSGNVTTKQSALLASNESNILKQTFRLYGSIYLCCFVAFCYLRRPRGKYAQLYNIRSWVPDLLSPLATRIDYKCYVGWVYQVFSVNDDDLLEQCGMVRRRTRNSAPGSSFDFSLSLS